MRLPLVSIIVPVYNGQLFIAEAIESILSQTYHNLEIIVVNDGSTDSSEQVLKPYLHNIKYIYQNNTGIAGAYNTGLKYCSGNYICFLEQDDIWLPHKTAKQVNYLEKTPNAGMVYSQYYIKNSRSTSNKYSISTMDLQGKCFEDLFRRILEGPTIITFSSVMIRKIVLDEVGSFDEKLHISVDYDLWLKIAFMYDIGFISEPALEYRIHDSNTSSNVLAAMQDDCYILESWKRNKRVYEILQADLVKTKLWGTYSCIINICRMEQKSSCERTYIRKMLKLNLLAARLWVRYLLTFIGRQGRNHIDWYAMKIRKILRMIVCH